MATYLLENAVYSKIATLISTELRASNRTPVIKQAADGFSPRGEHTVSRGAAAMVIWQYRRMAAAQPAIWQFRKLPF